MWMKRARQIRSATDKTRWWFRGTLIKIISWVIHPPTAACQPPPPPPPPPLADWRFLILARGSCRRLHVTFIRSIMQRLRDVARWKRIKAIPCLSDTVVTRLHLGNSLSLPRTNSPRVLFLPRNRAKQTQTNINSYCLSVSNETLAFEFRVGWDFSRELARAIAQI